MLGSLQLLTSKLDLDAAWVASQEFDVVTDEELESSEGVLYQKPDWRTCLAWFAPLMLHSLDSNAAALHLLRDRSGKCLRQLIWTACNEQGKWTPSEERADRRQWFELVPMFWPLLDVGFQTVRTIAFMMPWSKRGVIRYRYQGEWAKARCAQESPDDLVIYFTADRPALRRLTSEPLATQ